jgi:fidgetin-like protein 1
MSRNKALAQLQKTYDESYLSCSTAVYYENQVCSVNFQHHACVNHILLCQGNEEDARRCWRNALDQIYDHQASRSASSYVPNSETEKALSESLQELERQCKERIDLLEALRISRLDGSTGRGPGSTSVILIEPPGTEVNERGWIGGGTIPAISYPELSRPRPALPPRPSLVSRKSSELAVVGSSSRSSLEVSGSSNPQLSLAPLTITSSKEKTLRSPSPEKHTMRTTLRSNKPADKTSKLLRKHPFKAPEAPGASKAATVAWSATSLKDRPQLSTDVAASSLSSSSPQLTEQLRKSSTSSLMQWDSHSRRLVPPRDSDSPVIPDAGGYFRHSDEYSQPRPSILSISAASSALSAVPGQDTTNTENISTKLDRNQRQRATPVAVSASRAANANVHSLDEATQILERYKSASDSLTRPKPLAVSTPPIRVNTARPSDLDGAPTLRLKERRKPRSSSVSSVSDDPRATNGSPGKKPRRKLKEAELVVDSPAAEEEELKERPESPVSSAWQKRRATILKNLPSGVDESAAKQILNEIVVHGDEVHWSDVAGLQIAKNALRETVVYPFLRPDLFMGLREPARGMLLFGPPGTGKTMLARAVATESKSTFFSISASSLTSKYLGESEKLVRALFALAKTLAPSIIFVDEIDSLLSQRSGSGDHEATRRIKTEFLIQWSDLQRAAAGREISDKDRERGDATRVLVLAATNLPWAIDEAARRRFVRRQYIPLPEPETRATQLRTLLGQQKHLLSDADIAELVNLTDGACNSFQKFSDGT